MRTKIDERWHCGERPPTGPGYLCGTDYSIISGALTSSTYATKDDGRREHISPDWRFRWSSPRFGSRVRSKAATSRRLQGLLYWLIQRRDEIVLDRELLTHL